MTSCRDDPVNKLIRKWVRDNKVGKTLHPYEVNCGLCVDLSEYVERELPGADSLWVDTLIDTEGMDLSECNHTIIRYKGKFYDAEVPCGVKSLRDVPVIKNTDNRKYHDKMWNKLGLWEKSHMERPPGGSSIGLVWTGKTWVKDNGDVP